MGHTRAVSELSSFLLCQIVASRKPPLLAFWLAFWLGWSCYSCSDCTLRTCWQGRGSMGRCHTLHQDHGTGFFLSHISSLARSMIFPFHCSARVRLSRQHCSKWMTVYRQCLGGIQNVSRYPVLLFCIWGSRTCSPLSSSPLHSLVAAGEHAGFPVSVSLCYELVL